jgi:hypothetical protein
VYRDKKLLVKHMEERYEFGLLRLDRSIQVIKYRFPRSRRPVREAVKPLVGLRPDFEHLVRLYRTYVYGLVEDLQHSAN